LKSQIISGIVSQHAEEAAFLWLLRSGAACAPHYLLLDLARLDGRLEAHLDGLRVNGEPAWQLSLEALATGEAGEVFAAAVLAYESDNQSRIEPVLQAGLESPSGAQALVSALGWLTKEHAQQLAQWFLSSEQPPLRRLGIAALAIHRRADVQSVRKGVEDPDPSVQVRALRALGEMGHVSLVPLAMTFLNTSEPELRFAAAWSCALLGGDARSFEVLCDLDNLPKARWEAALQVALRRMGTSAARTCQEELSRSNALLRLAVQAAGIIGDPVAVSWLLEQMGVPTLARIAGEAFSMITGVHIAYQKLEGEPPEGLEAGPTEDPEDENVEMDLDRDLYWPNAELVTHWWRKNRTQFQTGARYLCGKPITTDWLQQVLREGYQRQRAAAALELAIRNPGQPLFNVKAPGFRQQQMLGIK
jgi:uncharacterized protein (TIGR02270 family)